jgi:hypothetical protein
MVNPVVAVDLVQRSILSIRGHRVMLDADLARLYAVEVRVLNQAVKRNAARFPDDFAFRLTAEEVALLKSQSVISSRTTHGGARRALPMVFTEQGVAMLSGVLTSPRAVVVNVAIMRAFVEMRRVLTTNTEFAKRLAVLEAEMAKHAAEFGHHKAETIRALKVVFESLKAMSAQVDVSDEPRPKVGFDLTRPSSPQRRK